MHQNRENFRGFGGDVHRSPKDRKNVCSPKMCDVSVIENFKGHQTGGFQRGEFPNWTCPSFFVLFLSFLGLSRFFWTFPICSGMVRGFSRFVPFLFLGLLRAPMRNSPERVRDTIWTFPEKSGKPPGWNPPGLASLKTLIAAKMGKNYPHSGSSLRYLICDQNSPANGDARCWCSQKSPPISCLGGRGLYVRHHCFV